MTIGILGSGSVGKALAHGFMAEGHTVYIATREPDGVKGTELKAELDGATIADFAETAIASELAVLCVNVRGLQEAVELIGAENLAGKVVIDTTNSLEPVGTAMIDGGGETSKAEQIQGWLPSSLVVKAFNTVGAATMYKPDFGDQRPTMFIAGDDAAAKKQVGDIVVSFGWENLDCGDLLLARSLESMTAIWVSYVMASGSPHHAFKML